MKRSEVVAVAPALLTIKAAASYCACSPGFLDKLRAQDVKRRARGESLVGPEWQRAPQGIRYAPEALRAWLARSSETCGVMESRRRERSTAEAVQP